MFRFLGAMCLSSALFLTACTDKPASTTNTIAVSSILSDLQLVNTGISAVVNNATGIPASTVDQFNAFDAPITATLQKLAANATGDITLSDAQGDVQTVETNVNAMVALFNNLVSSGAIKETSFEQTTLASVNTLLPVVEALINAKLDTTTDSAVFKPAAASANATAARQQLLTVH